MKDIRFTSVFVFALSLLVITSNAQRPRKPTPKATPKPTPVRRISNPVVDVAKLKVSNQLHNVKVFVDKMGPIAVGIENADRDAAARRLSKELVATNESNKKKVIASIRALREGLVALETEFRTKPQLSPYLNRIEGITVLCGQSEDAAIAGRFVESKEPLREISLKLNETLVVMNGGVAPPRTTSNASSAASASGQRTIVVSNPASSNQPASTGKREPAIGMTPAEVLQTSWGEPSSKRVSTTTTEVWVYSGNRTIYFYNGKVSQILKN
jgi:hypothetical protein